MSTPVRTRKRTSGPERLVAYSRVSTGKQADSGGGLDAQEAAIRAEVARRGAELVAFEVDGGVSGTSTKGRDALTRALDVVRSGLADGIIVTKLDRLSRSVKDFATIAEEAKANGWNVIVMDLGIDLSTMNGRLFATILSGLAEWEAEIIGERTSAGMQAKKETGSRFGRRSKLPADVADRVVSERAAGRTLTQIAEGLTADNIPTATGKATWWASTVKQVLTTAELDAHATARTALASA